MVFFHPVLAVGEEEVEHLVLAVVEAQRVPRGVLAAPGVVVEVEVDRAVEAPDALVLVLHGVGVDDVHDYGYAEAVGLVDEGFELVGGAETARSGEEVRHMVAEGTVVGMLLYGHDLDGVVAVGGDARQNLCAEVGVGAHAFFLLRHAYVALVDEQGLSVGLEALVGPAERLGGSVDLCGEYVGRGVLDYSRGIGRDAFVFAAGPLYEHLVELSVVHGAGSEMAFPYSRQTAVEAFELVLRDGLPARRNRPRDKRRWHSAPIRGTPSCRRRSGGGRNSGVRWRSRRASRCRPSDGRACARRRHGALRWPEHRAEPRVVAEYGKLTGTFHYNIIVVSR